MNRQFGTAWRLHTFLSARSIPYAVAFALEHRVLPVNVPGGSEADISERVWAPRR
ncbi:MAG: hypothetical protein WAP47_16900 [Candidatus Rokuibacteriota bacterium]